MFTDLRTLLFALLLACAPAGAHASSPGLTKEAAEAAIRTEWEELRTRELDVRKRELDAKEIKVGGVTMQFVDRTFGTAPAGGHSLWISMHGGGGTAAAVNDGQYRNQQKLYETAEGIWVIPRAPNDAWNMWHESHIDALFDRVIENYVLVHGVNPNRVYILGYSAGGDGVYQLAPRMADRFAAAAMMAGHPNEASPLGLRNLPFALFMGGKDGAYKRNEVAREWGAKLGELRASDPDGYDHWVQIYPEFGHWMNRKDAEALPWMEKRTRKPWPSKVVWHQDDVVHSRFYWLALPEGVAAKDQKITAEVAGQTIRITAEGTNRLELRLHDQLVDLEKPIVVEVNGVQRHSGPVARTVDTIRRSLAGRADPTTAATATLALEW